MKVRKCLTNHRIIAEGVANCPVRECRLEAVRLSAAEECDVEFKRSGVWYAVFFGALLKQVKEQRIESDSIPETS